MTASPPDVHRTSPSCHLSRYRIGVMSLDATRGVVSPVGRTQTAPDEPGVTHVLRLAFVSCSNYTGGFFTAYRGLAARDDLDAVLHLGDYLYEYGNDPREADDLGSGDRYGPPALIGVRDHRPDTEIVSLEDYRVRHARSG